MNYKLENMPLASFIHKLPLVFLLAMCLSFIGQAQEIKLYSGSIPNSKVEYSEEMGQLGQGGMIRKVLMPSIEVFQPSKDSANGTAVLIIPGGGYGVVVYQGEGVGTAKEFVKKGITAFVLKYRLPNDSMMVDKSIAPLQDAQQAIKYIREHHTEWGIDAKKVGVVGFSAGGHLASTVATHFNKSYIDNPENTSLRPDFQILVYPVITMEKQLTHGGSRNSLLGLNPSDELVNLFSNEKQVTSETPIAYLTHAADDKVVDVDNTIHYFDMLRKNKVETEMHIYPKGDHGFIFRFKEWIDPMFGWMKRNNLIK